MNDDDRGYMVKAEVVPDWVHVTYGPFSVLLDAEKCVCVLASNPHIAGATIERIKALDELSEGEA